MLLWTQAQALLKAPAEGMRTGPINSHTAKQAGRGGLPRPHPVHVLYVLDREAVDLREAAR